MKASKEVSDLQSGLASTAMNETSKAKKSTDTESKIYLSFA